VLWWKKEPKPNAGGRVFWNILRVHSDTKQDTTYMADSIYQTQKMPEDSKKEWAPQKAENQKGC
tara:strand:+ start:190 stop:381 length:192 start_codon:yes stop_codon:yes gene_type:complete